MAENFGPPFALAGGAAKGDSPVGGCQDVELEVEFFDCPDEEAIKSSRAALKRLPYHTSIYDDEALPLHVIRKRDTYNQYINLPRKDKYRGHDPDKNPKSDPFFAVDRAGYLPRILVRVKHKRKDSSGSLSRRVKVILEADGNNNIHYNILERLDYKDDRAKSEKERLGKDLCLETEVTTDKSGYFIIDGQINLATLAGNRYRIKAFVTDDKCLAASSRGVIETWRYMWIQKILCGAGQWQPQNDPFACIPDVADVYKKHFIRIDDSEQTILRREYEFLDRTPPKNNYARKWRDTIPKGDKHPYVASIACSRMMGKVSDGVKTIPGVKAGPGANQQYVAFTNLIASYRNNSSGKYDNSNLELKCFFNGRPVDERYVQYVGMSNNGSNGIDNYFLATHIVVDMEKINTLVNNEVGSLDVSVKTIDSIERSAGFAWYGTNYTWITAEYHWQDPLNPFNKIVYDNTKSDAMKVIIVHELGHMLGLMPNGWMYEPDKTKNTYCNVDKNEDLVLSEHRTEHCKDGYRMSFIAGPKQERNPTIYKERETDSAGNVQSYDPGTCAMYGMSESSVFCQDCSDVLRKFSSKKGWAK